MSHATVTLYRQSARATQTQHTDGGENNTCMREGQGAGSGQVCWVEECCAMPRWLAVNFLLQFYQSVTIRGYILKGAGLAVV